MANKCAQFFTAPKFYLHLGKADIPRLHIHYKHNFCSWKEGITSGPWSSSSSIALCNFTGFFKPPWQHVWHPLHQRDIGTLLPCRISGAEVLSASLPNSSFPLPHFFQEWRPPLTPFSQQFPWACSQCPCLSSFPHYRSLTLCWDPSFPSCTSSRAALTFKNGIPPAKKTRLKVVKDAIGNIIIIFKKSPQQQNHMQIVKEQMGSHPPVFLIQ